MNEEQREAINYAVNLQSFCLVGSAGSGKTTTTRMIAQGLLESGRIADLGYETRWLRADSPSIVFVSFTNQAVTNIRSAVPEEFKANCLTIHKLLEYSPVFYEIQDPITGVMRKTMRYEPLRGAHNPIRGLSIIVIEEAGTVEVHPLYANLLAALPPNCVQIFLGDLNQLPPVFGDAILGFKLIELPVVQLVHSYRTDHDSPIRKFTYKILEGKPLSDKEVMEYHVPGELEFFKFTAQIKDWQDAVMQMGRHLQGLVQKHFDTGGKEGFNYEEDIILIPYQKSFGAIQLNNFICDTISKNLGNPTYEVVVGINKKYLAVGDLVFHAKNKWKIVGITENSQYLGKRAKKPSLTMDRFGHDSQHQEEDLSPEDLFNKIMDMEMGSSNKVNFQQASHVIELEDVNGYRENAEVSTVGEINAMYPAPVMSIHKAMGSEWNRVYCIFHDLHSNMLCRESIYTACTRARKYMKIYYSGESMGKGKDYKYNNSVFQKGIIRQEIPGNNLNAKIDYFKQKLRTQAIKIETKRARDTGTPVNPDNMKMDAVAARKLLYSMTSESKQLVPSGKEKEVNDILDQLDED
jgi:ATP-dependent exoDNAse (exonuclease V) alpha subunit